MDAILLAAGNSTRFEGNKLLHEIDGMQMYRIVLEHLYALLQEGVLENLVVVTQYEEIEKTIISSMEEVVVVRNMRSEEGISLSIQLGVEKIEQVNEKSEACMFCVCDQPYMRRETIGAFVKDYEAKSEELKREYESSKREYESSKREFESGKREFESNKRENESSKSDVSFYVNGDNRFGEWIGVCACGNRMGNPVIFSKQYYEELKQIIGDKGGKQVAMKHLEDVYLFPVEEQELEDVDVRCND